MFSANISQVLSKSFPRRTYVAPERGMWESHHLAFTENKLVLCLYSWMDCICRTCLTVVCLESDCAYMTVHISVATCHPHSVPQSWIKLLITGRVGGLFLADVADSSLLRLWPEANTEASEGPSSIQRLFSCLSLVSISPACPARWHTFLILDKHVLSGIRCCLYKFWREWLTH